MTISTRPRKLTSAHAVLVALIGLVIGALLALGSSAPAFATTTVQVMIKVVNKAGTALPTSEVSALQDDSGVEPYGDVPVNATAASGKPGYFTATLVVGETYTLAIIPTGASQLDGDEEFMGGGQDFNAAQTFVPSATETFVTAVFATEGVITGKVTSPSGAPLKNAEAEDFVFDGGQWFPGSYTMTNSSGVYTLTDLQPGSYIVKFFPPTGAYPPVYSGAATTLGTATPGVVLPNKPLTVNAKFATSTGSISGTSFVIFAPDNLTYPSQGAVATAYPVLTQSSGEAVTIDYGAAVSSAPVDSEGRWKISNLRPGTYVVAIEAGYYNETSEWVGATQVGFQLAHATLFTIVAGSKLAAGDTDLGAQNQIGDQPDVMVYNFNGTQAVSGAEVSLTSDVDGFVYLTGTSGMTAGVPVNLFFGDGIAANQSNLEPGWYTVTVIDPTGAHEPYVSDTYFDFGEAPLVVDLPTVTHAPAFTTQPTIAQTDLQVGTSYAVSGQVAARSDATFQYQWQRDGQPIYGATGASYLSTGADFNHQLSVRVSAVSFGFNDVSTYAYVQGGDETAGPAPVNTGAAPSISPATGAAFFGSALQANVGGWNETGLHFHYRWQSNGADVGTDSSTYAVAESDIDQPITVAITATKTGYDDSAPVVSPVPVTPAAHPAPLNTKSPVVTKTASHGTTTYSASTGTWSVTGLSYSYQWSAGTATLVSPTSAKLVVSGTAAWDDPLELTVTTMKDGYLQGSKTIVVQKGTAVFSQTLPPTVHDTETASDVGAADQAVHVGEHLTVTQPANWTVAGSVQPDSYSYRWYRTSTAPGAPAAAIAGATTSTYVVTSADVGQLLSAQETTVSATYTAASIFAPAGLGTTSSLLQTAPPSVTINGVAAQGQVLSVAVGAWPVTGTTTSYQWVDCPQGGACTSSDPTTYLPIPKATKSTLTVLASYANIAVRITGTKAGYATETEFSTSASADPATKVDNLSAPTMSGTSAGDAHVGAKLTAVSGKFSVSGLPAQYVWQVQECLPNACDSGQWTTANGAAPTSSSYTPVEADMSGADDWSIRVEETVSKTGYDTTANDSLPVLIGLGTIKATKTPPLTTTAGAFTINPGTYTPAGGVSFVRWYTDGTVDNPDPNPSMPQLARDTTNTAGHAVFADVTYSVPGYNDLTTRVVAQLGVMNDPDPESVTGAAFGDTLGVSEANPFTDAGSYAITPSYQWYSNSTAIKGATGPTFPPTTAYIGKHIQVKVTGTSPLYGSKSVESPSTFVLGSGGLGSLTSPTITYSGALQPGTVMTSVLGTGYVPSGVTIARQWQKSTNSGGSWVNVSKATTATYTPSATDVGAEFRVQVISSKAGYGTQTQWSEPETVLYSPVLATLAPPIVTGTATVGSVLTADPGAWNAPGLTYTYQWYRDDILIPGATSSTFTSDYTDATDTLSFTVTASAVGYQSVTVSSNDQVIGLGTIAATTLPKISAVGASFAVSTGAWAVDGLTFTYQWSVGGASVSGATTDTYTPSGGDVGVLSVAVTARRTGYTPLTIVVNGPTLG